MHAEGHVGQDLGAVGVDVDGGGVGGRVEDADLGGLGHGLGAGDWAATPMALTASERGGDDAGEEGRAAGRGSQGTVSFDWLGAR